jgi:glutamate-1-semialdehyde 2,1-aminomutase
MTAVRLARGYTERDIVIKMDGCYHGHSDSLLVSAGSGVAENTSPSSSGVSKSVAGLTCSIPYNDIQAIESAFNRNKDNVAAVLVEPVAANMGVILPQEEYLKKLRKICDENDALLIFDEVITGFRICYGGAQHIYNVHPDITCLGKIIGGGFPLAGFGGRADIMDKLSPLGDVYQAGTLSGNPVATAAAIATLDILQQHGCYEKLDSSGAALQEGLEYAAEKTGTDIKINRIGSLMSCFFTKNPVNNFEDACSGNMELFKKYADGMLSRGIYIAPSVFESMFVSLAHTESDITDTVDVFMDTLKNIKG